MGELSKLTRAFCRLHYRTLSFPPFESQRQTMVDAKTGIAVGLAKGHVVTKHEQVPRPANRKGVRLGVFPSIFSWGRARRESGRRAHPCLSAPAQAWTAWAGALAPW